MDTPNHSIIAENTPLFLTIEEMTFPLGVITTMFQGLRLDDMRGLLEEVFESAICRPDDGQGAFSREDLFFLKKEIIRFVEAAFWLHVGKKDLNTANH